MPCTRKGRGLGLANPGHRSKARPHAADQRLPTSLANVKLANVKLASVKLASVKLASVKLAGVTGRAGLN